MPQLDIVKVLGMTWPLVAAVVVSAVLTLVRSPGRVAAILRPTLALLAAANILFVLFLCFDHAWFPLNLDLMEGTILEHFQRAAAGKPIYPEPTPGYVPLAYNPLYYIFSVPFSWIFGVRLFTLRLVAILGMLGSGLVIYRVVREQTMSRWWGFMGVGLFAAAYRVMDAYLDTAHSDSWMLCTALLGTYMIGRTSSRPWRVVGVVCLVAAFWFKQHGALFVVGGLVFLTYDEGLRAAIPYWVIAFLLGPFLYLSGGNALLGSHFHYFTWEVPSQWTEVTLYMVARFVGFVTFFYLVLALAGGWAVVRSLPRPDVWRVQFVCAFLSGVMGTLDPGSSNNVFIPMGAWFIVMGATGLHELEARAMLPRLAPFHLRALLAAFLMLMYDPQRVIVSPQAAESYDGLIAALRTLNGPVYAPWLGQLENGYAFYPTAHWVALEDMIRGPGRERSNHPMTRKLLDPAVHPHGPAFILANYEVDIFEVTAFLKENYVLACDLGDRFKPLRVLPKRADHGWPRYLYRYRRHGIPSDTPPDAAEAKAIREFCGAAAVLPS